MPEVRECDASGRIIRWGFGSARAAGANLTVQGLYCDYTETEAEKAWRGHPGWAPDSNRLQIHAYSRPVPVPDAHITKLVLRDVWDSSVMVVHRKVRGHDLVFQATWMLPKVPLLSPPSVYHAPTQFLSNVSDWIQKRYFKRPNKRTGTRLATDAVRSLQDIFHGVGAYTSQELLYMAGISPFLTEREVFLNPSRTAQRITALYTFIKYGEDNIEKLLREAMLEGVLAPTIDQRKFYAYWLYVWAKDEIRMSARMKVLVQEYNALLATYENHPHNISRGSLTELREAGSGFTWPCIFYRFKERQVNGFVSTQRYSGHTPTQLKYYLPLFLHENLISKAVVPVRADSAGVAKKIWTPLADFPPCLRLANTVPLSDAERYAALFSTTVGQMKEAAIGPLEYNGNGHRVHIGNGKYLLAVCMGDPRIPAITKIVSLTELSTEQERSKLRKIIGRFDAGYKREEEASLRDAFLGDLFANKPKLERRWWEETPQEFLKSMVFPCSTIALVAKFMFEVLDVFYATPVYRFQFYRGGVTAARELGYAELEKARGRWCT
ncbi:hypothetical protein C8F01DRAFT_1261289 [Mycena amicta]|nr:hypothetical protein C8F01DRAFT_1261289 [Mycena amicta]